MVQTLENYPPEVDSIKSVAVQELLGLIPHYWGSRRVVVGTKNQIKISKLQG